MYWKQTLQNDLQNARPEPLVSAGAPEEIRTPDPQIRSLVLYPAELRARFSRAFQGAGPVMPHAFGKFQRSRRRAIATGSRQAWQGPTNRLPLLHLERKGQ